MCIIKRTGIIILILMLFQAALLLIMGQPLICTCGYIKLWEGSVASTGNSQHLTDWYTFSHILHGFIFYFLTWILFPKASFGFRLALAVGLEVSWEVLENTPWVIDRYRQQALAQGYIGDSVINSLSDTLSMIIGFVVARKLPWWLTLCIAIALELGMAYAIHDNLTLNIINLIQDVPQIRAWQMQLYS